MWKYRVSTVMCIVLLVLQLNSLVNATAGLDVSGGDAMSSELVGSGFVLGDTDILPDVSGGDGGIVPDVSGGDGGTVPDVSGGDGGTVPDVSGGDGGIMPDVSSGDGGTMPDVSGGNAQAGEETENNNSQATGGKELVSDRGDIAEEISEENTINIEALPGVVGVRVPQNLNFVMDPLGICKRGPIWSEPYAFVNSGEIPIVLSLNDIKCVAREGVSLVQADMDVTSLHESFEKLIRIQMDIDDGETIVMTDTGSHYEVILEPGQQMTFSISGDMSLQPMQSWMSGDVSISIVYSATEYISDAYCND